MTRPSTRPFDLTRPAQMIQGLTRQFCIQQAGTVFIMQSADLRLDFFLDISLDHSWKKKQNGGLISEAPHSRHFLGVGFIDLSFLVIASSAFGVCHSHALLYFGVSQTPSRMQEPAATVEHTLALCIGVVQSTAACNSGTRCAGSHS